MPVQVQPGATVPVQTQPPAVPPQYAAPVQPAAPQKPKRITGRVVLIGILVVLLAIAFGGLLGYQDGMNSRRGQQASAVAMEAATQFQLGLKDLNEGRLDVAKTRFEYVISIDPSFPGVKEKLAEVLFTLAQQANPTATVEPTQFVEPTPDTSNEDTQWNFILKQMAGKNWDAAINGMDGLRKINLQYRPVDVDGMYFIALRFRGVDKMLKYADLEGGIYDLSQAEKFTALDRDADSWRTFARLYLTGAAYWDVNWEKVVEIFSQVAPYLPNLRDSSGMTAMERYRIGALKLSESYLKNDAYCKASKLYESILAMGRNSTLEPTATWLANKCNPPTKTPTPKMPTLTPSLTLTGTLIAPTATLSNTVAAPATATPTSLAATRTPTPPPPTATSPSPTK